MKKTLIKTSSILLGLTALLSFSSCLKDSRFVDFAAVGTTIDIPLGGVSNFSKGSLTESTDEIIKQFAVNISSPKPLSKDLTITLGVDAAALTAYNASQTAVAFEPFPTDSYTIDKTSVVVPAGTRTQVVTVKFDKTKLDPAKSYLLAISITDAQGETINGNYHTKYYSIIGNDFAGQYAWHFERRNNGDGSGAPAAGSFDDEVTVYPVTPRQFEVTSGYYVATERYEVTFEKPDATHYKNFKVTLNATDVANIFTPNGITVTQQPVIYVPYDATKSYTFAEALQLLTFQYKVNTGADRFLIDKYTKL
nr:DUF1735 domain-containing protein [uncultured Mucilaginibacter sp.]